MRVKERERERSLRRARGIERVITRGVEAGPAGSAGAPTNLGGPPDYHERDKESLPQGSKKNSTFYFFLIK